MVTLKGVLQELMARADVEIRRAIGNRWLTKIAPIVPTRLWAAIWSFFGDTEQRGE